MPNFDEFLKGKQAAQLMGDKGKLEKLRDAPETQQIFSMLSRSTGDLEAAADRAAKGDTAAMVQMVNRIMESPEGAELVERINKAARR